MAKILKALPSETESKASTMVRSRYSIKYFTGVYFSKLHHAYAAFRTDGHTDCQPKNENRRHTIFMDDYGTCFRSDKL